MRTKPHRPLPRALARWACALWLLGLAAPSHAGGRFGDSTWVAPGVGATADPASPGPRISLPDHERRWESVLRAPFRAAFLPAKLLARGLEASADRFGGLATPAAPGTSSDAPDRPGFRVAPVFAYPDLAGPAIGARATSERLAGKGTHLGAISTWSIHDHRRLGLRAVFGEGVGAMGGGIDGLYHLEPNRRFYGIGNDAPSRRTIYLRRENRVDGWVSLGRRPENRLRAIVGIADRKIGNGYGGDDVPHAADVFSTAEVPFLRRGFRVWSIGAGADVSRLDEPRDPARGVRVRGEARHVRGLEPADLEYRTWGIEGRGYLPVFANRRVLEFRAALRGIDPERGSSPIPFDVLPESSEDDRFPAYSPGRFRDRRLVLAHVEYRWVIWNDVWAMALAQRGAVAQSSAAFRYADMHESLGGGLQFRMGEARAARFELVGGTEGVRVQFGLKEGF